MRFFVFFGITFLITILGCTKELDPIVELATEYQGSNIEIGNGHAWSYVKTDDNQVPISIGIQFQGSCLIDLPTEGLLPTEFTLELPSEIAVPPYDHITMDWNAHGHPPMMVYDLPHFDFHFYFMSEAERDDISPFDTIEFAKPLDPQNLAPLYLETPDGVPRMGAHIIDLMSPEIAGTGVFNHTFIYGKYNGVLNFLEPMVTKNYLDAKEDLTKEIRQPEKWMEAGFYPLNYQINYVEEDDLYELLLIDLQKNE